MRAAKTGRCWTVPGDAGAMRLFAAVLPPPDVVAELADAVGRLRSGRDAPSGADLLRWTQPENWHLTLAFCAHVPEPASAELHERLARAAARSRPMELCLTGAGRFGQRALWAAVEGETAALGRLAASCTAAARRTGVAMDEPRGFRAHLTVAHVRRRDADAGVDLREYTGALADFRGRSWTAEELTLVRSHLPVSGVPGEQPRYEPVAGWPLGR